MFCRDTGTKEEPEELEAREGVCSIETAILVAPMRRSRYTRRGWCGGRAVEHSWAIGGEREGGRGGPDGQRKARRMELALFQTAARRSCVQHGAVTSWEVVSRGHTGATSVRGSPVARVFRVDTTQP